MDAWLDLAAFVFNLSNTGVSPCIYPRTGGKLLLTGRCTSEQKRHKVFVVREGKFVGYPGPYLYVYCSAARKKLLTEPFLVEAVEIPPKSVFAGHGYVLQAGSELRSEHCIRYYSCLIPENHNLPDSTAFRYGDCIAFAGSKAFDTCRKEAKPAVGRPG